MCWATFWALFSKTHLVTLTGGCRMNKQNYWSCLSETFFPAEKNIWKAWLSCCAGWTPLLFVFRIQSYDFLIYNYSARRERIFKVVEENIFVFKTRSATRGFVNFSSSGFVTLDRRIGSWIQSRYLQLQRQNRASFQSMYMGRRKYFVFKMLYIDYSWRCKFLQRWRCN
jgi:hypothetical protein